MTTSDPTRREVLQMTAAAGAAAVVGPLLGPGSALAAGPVAPAQLATQSVTFMLNGRPRSVSVEPRVSLLDLLRERLDLTGTRKGCDHGQCGACTVHVDGRRVNACLQLAVMQEGHAVTTIEGIAGRKGALHPMQAAFIRHDAFQCGYCTPGQVMSAIALVGEGRDLSDESIRGWMSGNLCRCGAYQGIVAAIREAAGEMRGAKP